VNDAHNNDGDERGDEETTGEEDTGGGRWPVDRLQPVLEALIFAAGDPLAVRKICEIVEGATRPEVIAALEQIQGDCKARGFRLVQVAGGWQFRTAPQHHGIVKQLFKEKPHRLTRAAFETLAVVAYRQPATRAEVESIRGVDCSGVLENLVERRLLRIAGRRDVPGRPLVYATTPEFLELFELKDLRALPTLPELGDEFETLASRSGFEEGDERDAPIVPVEEGDLGDEIETSSGEQAGEAGAGSEEARREARRSGEAEGAVEEPIDDLDSEEDEDEADDEEEGDADPDERGR
jgi:segregation and condensation protein B